MSDDVERQLRRAHDFLRAIPGAAEKATARALTAAARAGREVAIRSIGDRYVVHAGDVREKVTVTAATPSDSPTAAIIARSGSLPLSYFPHTPLQAGTGGPGKPPLRVEVLRGQEREVAGAFVATIGGKPRIMIRTGGTTKTGRAQIKSLQSVPIASMLGAESVREAVEQRVVDVIDDRLNREIDRALKEPV